MKPERCIAEALVVTIVMPIWTLTFVALWIVAWVCAVVALALGLLSLGKLTLPRMSKAMAAILSLPKKFCMSRPDPK